LPVIGVAFLGMNAPNSAFDCFQQFSSFGFDLAGHVRKTPFELHMFTGNVQSGLQQNDECTVFSRLSRMTSFDALDFLRQTIRDQTRVNCPGLRFKSVRFTETIYGNQLIQLRYPIELNLMLYLGAYAYNSVISSRRANN